MTFISAGADLLGNPISSFYAMKKVETAVDNTRQVPKPKDATRKIFHTTKTTEVSPKEPNESNCSGYSESR